MENDLITRTILRMAINGQFTNTEEAFEASQELAGVLAAAHFCGDDEGYAAEVFEYNYVPSPIPAP